MQRAKTTPPRVLENTTRAALERSVAQTPGINVAALARRLAVSRGSVRHHVDMLLRARHLEVVRVGGQAQVFLCGGVDGMRPRPARDRVRAEIEGSPGVTQQALARRLNLGRKAVRLAVDELVREQRVWLRRESGALRHFGLGVGPMAGKGQVAEPAAEATVRP